MSVLDDKKLLLGVTGGISCYKVCDVIRALTGLGADIQVVMTRAAQQFMKPLTFETLTNHPVLTEIFSENEMVATRHVDIPRDRDIMLICPATANFIGKMANGIADDLLSTMVTVAGPDKTLVCPAMNSDMWENPIVQNNLNILRKYGVKFVEPEEGQLACDTKGKGKLASVERIVSNVKIELLRTEEFKNKHIVVTAGPTEEALDPVRFITNASSGKMGFSLAEAALSRGANVTLISGPTSLIPPDNATTIWVRSADEMKEATLDATQSADIVIMAAAVSDYRPAQFNSSKIKKNAKSISIELQKTPDILSILGERKKYQILVGFAVETDNENANALKKLREKQLDLIVVNNPNVKGAGFKADTNVVTLIEPSGEEKDLSMMSKFEVSLNILDEIAVLLGLKPAPWKPVEFV